MTDGSSEVKLFVNELICDFASDAITLRWALVESEWSHLICFFHILCNIYCIYTVGACCEHGEVGLR